MITKKNQWCNEIFNFDKKIYTKNKYIYKWMKYLLLTDAVNECHINYIFIDFKLICSH